MKSAREFAEDVTVTQLSLAARTRRFWLTCFWMLLFLAGVAFSIYQVVQLLQIFFSYPRSTQVIVSFKDTQETGGMRFPAVTICNKDPYNRSTFSNFTVDRQDTYSDSFDAQWDMLQITRAQQMSKNNIETPLYKNGERKRRDTVNGEDCIKDCADKDVLVRQILATLINNVISPCLRDFVISQCCHNDSETDAFMVTQTNAPVQTPPMRQKRGILTTVCTPRTDCDSGFRFIRQIWSNIKSKVLSRKRRQENNYCPCDTQLFTSSIVITTAPTVGKAVLGKKSSSITVTSAITSTSTSKTAPTTSRTTSTPFKATSTTTFGKAVNQSLPYNIPNPTSTTATTSNLFTSSKKLTTSFNAALPLTLSSTIKTTPSNLSTSSTKKQTTFNASMLLLLSSTKLTLNATPFLLPNITTPTLPSHFTIPFPLPSGMPDNLNINMNNSVVVPNGIPTNVPFGNFTLSGNTVFNYPLPNLYTLPINQNYSNVSLNGLKNNGTKSYPKYVDLTDQLLQQNLSFIDMVNQIPDLVNDYLNLNVSFNITEYLPPGLDLDGVVNLAAQMPVDDILNAMRDDKDKIVQFNENNKKTFGIPDNLNDSMFAAQCLKQIIPFALAVVPEYKLMKLGYQYATLFSRCAFEEHSCDTTNDFYPFFNRVMGNCWTFNHKNATNNNHTIQQSGFHHGLSLYLTVSQNTFMGSAITAGVKVLITDQEETVFPDTEGLVVPIGYTTDFAISMVSIDRVSAPYGNCVEVTDPEVYFYDGKYSNEGCLRSCYQKGIYEACGCYDPTLPVPTVPSRQYRICNATPDCTIDFECVNAFTENKATFMDTCDCRSPCHEKFYTYTKSIARRPDRVMRHYDLTEMKEPNVIVNVYFRTLTYITYEENPAYVLVNFFSDLGGVLGNNLGFSFITCFEMIFLATLIISACFAARN